MKYNQWTLSVALACLLGLNARANDPMGNSVLTEVSKTTLSGYVDTSAIWALGEIGHDDPYPGRSNDGEGYTDGFNLNVVQLSLSRHSDDTEWAAGYQVDLWLGPDAHWLSSFTSGTGTGELGIKQAYVDLHVPVGTGLELKMGHFDTIIGYEVGAGPANPNFSRSYGFFIEPFQHTGLLASYQLSEDFSVAGGVANSYGFGINDRAGSSESQLTYLGSATYVIPDSMGAFSGGSLYAGFVDGLVTGDDQRDKTSYFLGGTLPTPIKNLSLGGAFDYAQDTRDPLGVEDPFLPRDDNGNVLREGTILDAWAIAGYLSYQFPDAKTTFNGRIDYIQTDTFQVGTVEDMAIMKEARFLSLTGTVSHNLWENVLARVELRWDHTLEDEVFGFGPDGDEDDAVTLALNVAYQF